MPSHLRHLGECTWEGKLKHTYLQQGLYTMNQSKYTGSQGVGRPLWRLEMSLVELQDVPLQRVYSMSFG
jgi:hypothetical protein